MKLKRFNFISVIKRNQVQITKFLLVFILILLNSSSLFRITRFPNDTYYILYSFSIAAIFFIVLIKTKLKFSPNEIVILLSLSILVLISVLLNQDYSIKNFVIIALMLSAILIAKIISLDEFVNYYTKTMVFLAAYSLLMTYVILLLFPQVSIFFPTRINAGGFPVKDYLFYFQFGDGLSLRNTGIFREMGVYQIYLNIALIFELFFRKRKKGNIIILTLAIISTFSTPGLIQVSLTFFAYVWKYGKKELKRNFKLISIFAIIGFIIITLYPQTMRQFSYSVEKLTKGGNSYIGRINAINANIKLWADRPFFGNGITNAVGEAEIITGSLHNTSTITSFMAIYGIIFAIIITLTMLYSIKKVTLNRVATILVFIGVAVSINSQRLIYDSLYYILTFMYIMKENSEGKIDRRC